MTTRLLAMWALYHRLRREGHEDRAYKVLLQIEKLQ
jgi:hypothetical protein